MYVMFKKIGPIQPVAILLKTGKTMSDRAVAPRMTSLIFIVI